MKSLKVLIIGVVLLIFLALPALAVTLAWDSPTTNTDGSPLVNLAGYKVYYGITAGNYDGVIDIPVVSTYQVELPFGSNYVALTAYSTDGNESSYSNEIFRQEGEISNLKIVANKASEPGKSWCWNWNTESNLSGYHVIWTRYRPALETKVGNLYSSVPSSEYGFAQTNCIKITLPVFWTVTHIAVIAEDIDGHLGNTTYGHYVYGDIANIHNDGYSYQGTIVGTVDHAWIAYYNRASVLYTTNISQFANGTIYNLPAANKLELSDLYHDASNKVNYYDLMTFGYYGFGQRGTN